MSQEQITQETVPVAETTQTTTEAPKQETQIEQPVPTVAKSWKEAIPEDLRNDPNISKFTELEALAKSYINATRMIGQDKVAVPNNNSTDDQWNEVYDVFTVPVNLAGLPAISLPGGLDETGLPLGLQLIGKSFDEQTVLNAAYALEEKIGFQSQVKDWWM